MVYNRRPIVYSRDIGLKLKGMLSVGASWFFVFAFGGMIMVLNEVIHAADLKEGILNSYSLVEMAGVLCLVGVIFLILSFLLRQIERIWEKRRQPPFS